MAHIPVLLNEVLEIFDPHRGETYIDATVNGGGHARAILKRIGPRGQLLGIDWDCDLLEKLKRENRRLRIKNFLTVCDNYVNIKHIARKHKLGNAAGILFDLGFSSYHPEESKRGFSFLKDEPLDMRYNTRLHELTAEKIINYWPRSAIETILRDYGEERFSRRLASAIVRERSRHKITKTGELVEIIVKNIPHHRLGDRLHPATRTFQALRIAVNNELENLKHALQDSVKLLNHGGKIIIISFHSLEDRIVKRFIKEQEREGYIVHLEPLLLHPSRQEITLNPRARSAILRAAQKL